MEIDKELLKHVANVARLKLTDSELNKFLPQLKEVMEAFSRLEDVDTSKTVSSIQPVALRNVMREDKPGKCLGQEDALSQTKLKENGYFKGPKIV